MAEIKTVSCPVCHAFMSFENWSKVDEQIEDEMRKHLQRHDKVSLVETLMMRYNAR